MALRVTLPLSCLLPSTICSHLFQTLSAKAAAALDAELMSTSAYSLDQLMELAGLSVSQAVYRLHPPSTHPSILIACGPGNNGGDGLVAARHLYHYGYKPTMYYPKQSKKDIYQRLSKQLQDIDVKFVDDFDGALEKADVVVDAVFGFSFEGEVREPFGKVVEALEKVRSDIARSWRKVTR